MSRCQELIASGCEEVASSNKNPVKKDVPAAAAPKRTSKEAAVQKKPAEESKAPAATGVRRKAK